MMTYDEVKGRYMPHEIIDLYNAGELSYETMCLLLWGNKTPPQILLPQTEIEIPAERLEILE